MSEDATVAGERTDVADGGEDAESADADVDDGDESTTGLRDADVWRYLRIGAIGLLSLLALVATFQLYTNTSAAIAQWVSPTYVPVFQAAFNLVVLLLALAGLAVLARRRLAAD